MKIFVFGNPDLSQDALPLKILPRLRADFPDHKFVTVDPNEEWEVPEHLVAIDTAQGVKAVTVFDDLEAFVPPPRTSLHDFDALTNLRYLMKLGKLKSVSIIAVPPHLSEGQAVTDLIEVLRDKGGTLGEHSEDRSDRG